ncbi:MAG: hypothetical protein DRN18_04265, partial [Thermoplasmata archaeon]
DYESPALPAELRRLYLIDIFCVFKVYGETPKTLKKLYPFSMMMKRFVSVLLLSLALLLPGCVKESHHLPLGKWEQLQGNR